MKNMRHFLFFVIALTICGCANTINSSRPTLVGRWQAETFPTGYWIIDRFADGRYARKHLLNHDYSKPAEILVSWGRWEYDGVAYREITEGSTSDFVNSFATEWRDVEVDGLARDIFQFRSQEGYPRKEFRISGRGPLSRLPMIEPKVGDGGWTKPKHGIVQTHLANLPVWIDDHPH